jgi:hypothetical protein
LDVDEKMNLGDESVEFPRGDDVRNLSLFLFFTSIALILILKTSQHGNLSAIGRDRQSTLDGMLDESLDDPLSPSHSARDSQPSSLYSPYLNSLSSVDGSRWLRTSNNLKSFIQQASSSSRQHRKKRRKIDKQSGPSNDDSEGESDDDINAGEIDDDVNGDNENGGEEKSSMRVFADCNNRSSRIAREENGGLNDTNDDNENGGEEKSSLGNSGSENGSKTEDEYSDCDTVLLRDQNIQVEDNDHMVDGAIDKFAELKMSLGHDADVSSRTLRDDADVSSSSSTTLWTVAYDEIASLVCIVEEAHELLATVSPEVMTWYQDLRERVRKLSGTSLPSSKYPDLSSTSFDTASTKEDDMQEPLRMPASVSAIDTASTEVDATQEPLAMPASVSAIDTASTEVDATQEPFAMPASVSAIDTASTEVDATQEPFAMPASVSTVEAMQESSVSIEDAMPSNKYPNLSSKSFETASTEVDAMPEPLAMQASVSTVDTASTAMQESSVSMVDAMQESSVSAEDAMALPLQFIRDLHDITSSDELISVKIGLTGFMMAYYEPKGEHLDGVIDSKTLRPLGNHIFKDIRFMGQGRNLSKVNHDIFIISSLLQLYIQAYNQFHEDSPRIIEFMSSSLESYQRPLLSLKSLSTESLYSSVDPNGFCGYLAAATSFDCVDRNINPHHVSLQDLKQVSNNTSVFTYS